MKYYIVDVFAEQKYEGNPLAIFIPDRLVSATEMQKIAKEVNYSETTFILSDKGIDGGYDIRIFTPDMEIPFASHAAIGTSFVIRQNLELNKSDQVVLNLSVGQIPITPGEHEGNEYWMKQPEPTFGAVIEPQTIADILHINIEDIYTDYPVQIVSTGCPSVIVPLQSLQAAERCRIEHDKYRAFIEKYGNVNLLVFTVETVKPVNDLHVRVFTVCEGFLENPATGSANGNLASYLIEHNFYQDYKIRLRVEQGMEMRRPSRIEINAIKREGVYHIYVGGKVIVVAEGEWL